MEPTFSPDGETIVYRKSSGGHITSPLWSRGKKVCIEFRFAAVRQNASPSRAFDRNLASPTNESSTSKKIRTRKPTTSNYARSQSTANRSERITPVPGRRTTVSRPTRNTSVLSSGFHVFLAPFVNAGQPIQVGPKGNGLPIRKVSQEAGDWIQFSSDSKHLHWALGPKLYSVELEDALAYLNRPKASPDKDANTDDAPSDES